VTTNAALEKGVEPRTIGSGTPGFQTFTEAPRWAWPKGGLPFPKLNTLPSEIVGGVLTIPPTISDSDISFSIKVESTSTVTADWGDGTTESIAITPGVTTTISHSYSYTTLPYLSQVSTDSSLDTISRAGHGYLDNDSVYLYSDTPIAGIDINRCYLVTNATTNTFQLTTRRSGPLVSIGENTTAYLSTFKQVEVRVSPDDGYFTRVDFYNGNLSTKALWVGLFSKSDNITSSKYFTGLAQAGGGGLVSKVSQNNTNQTYFKSMFQSNDSIKDLSEFYSPAGQNFDRFLHGAKRLVDWPPNLSVYYATTLEQAFSYSFAKGSEPLILEIPDLKIPFCTTIYGMFQKIGSYSNTHIRGSVRISNMASVALAGYAFYGAGVSKVEWASSAVTSFLNTFGYGRFLKGRDVVLDYSSTDTFTQCFTYCRILTSVVYIPTHANTIEKMYYGCSSITSVPTSLGVITTQNTLHDLSGVFGLCNSLEAVDTTHWSFPPDSSPDLMFEGCISLKYVLWQIPNGLQTAWTYGNAYTFRNCTRLKRVDIDLEEYNTSVPLYSMFYGCTQLQTVQFTRIPIAVTYTSLAAYRYMYYNCYSLMKVDHTMDWTGVITDPSSKSYNQNQFTNCYSLQRFRPLNLEGQVSLENCKMSASALNEAYSALLPETPWGPTALLMGVEVITELGIPLSWNASLTSTQSTNTLGTLSTQGYNNFLTGVGSTLTTEPMSSTSPELGSLSGVAMTLNLSDTPPGIGGLDITVGMGSLVAIKEDRYHVRVLGNYGALDSDFTILEAKGYEAITA